MCEEKENPKREEQEGLYTLSQPGCRRDEVLRMIRLRRVSLGLVGTEVLGWDLLVSFIIVTVRWW